VAVVVRAPGAARPRLVVRRWGWVPRFARRTDGPRPINARVEDVAGRPAFRDALRRRRCLVPADGFYEWQRRGRSRAPHHLALPGDRLFAIAGLHDRWTAPGGAVLETCVLLTRAATPALARIHGRMPVLVSASAYDAWLDPALEEPEAALSALDGELAGELHARRVSGWVNDPRHDDPGCLAPDALPLFGTDA
jgi:putative SOS response-associated peptidase YedK